MAGPYTKINRPLQSTDEVRMADPAGGHRSIPLFRIRDWVKANWNASSSAAP